MTLRLLGVELLHSGGREGGQTSTTKAIVAFRNRANASKNGNKNNLGFPMPSLCVCALAL